MMMMMIWSSSSSPTLLVVNETYYKMLNCFIISFPRVYYQRVLEIILATKKKVEKVISSEAATQRCSMKKVFWKYAANLQENNHAEVWFQ